MQKVNIVLGRGLLGKKYSRGMDALGAKVAQLPGVDYVNVENYSTWRATRDRIRRWQDPTILIGHSFYANATTIIAEALPGVRFPLLITFDPSPYWSWYLWQAGPSLITPNVDRVVNFFQYGLPIGNQTLSRPGGNTDGIENIVIETTHTDIDDMPVLHERALNEIKCVIG